MAITKKKNKFVVPQIYDQSVIFASGGNLYSGTQNSSNQMSIMDNFGKSGNVQAGIGQALGSLQGVMQLGSQFGNNLSTSGIGSEVQNINDISRGDILNTNIGVDAKKSNVGGQALSGAMTGAQAGSSFGLLGAGIGAGVGALAGGISSIFGNKSKEEAAKKAEEQWLNNLSAKDRQFQEQDLKQSMANFNAFGGDLFAYGGNIKSPLTEFNSGGSHESNPNSGIMQGTGANGQPNLVEEGETKHEDYIFSNRLKINPEITKQFKLPSGLNGKTFAAASKYLNKEAKERPNDPISNNAVKAQLAKLTAAQEGLKEQMQPQQHQGIPMEGQPNANILEQGQRFAYGGDQTHYQNPTLQGANINADGGDINNFWGIKNGKYTQEFKDAVEKLYNDPVKSAQAVSALKNTGYIKSKDDLLKYTNDYKVGPVHEYMKENIPQPKQVQMQKDYYGDWPDPKHNYYLRSVKLSEVQKARRTDPNAYKGFEAGEPTGTTFAMGGNMFDGTGDSYLSWIQPQQSQQPFNMTIKNQMYPMAKQDTNKSWSPIQASSYIPQQNSVSRRTDILSKNIDKYGKVNSPVNNSQNTKQSNPKQSNPTDNNSVDFSRYAPVAANLAIGISDLFETPENVKYNRVDPELIKSRMDYQPIDTDWMQNKINSQLSANRSSILDASAGNRAVAMSGLLGSNQQGINSLGESYLNAQNINYGRQQQANQFNAGIEAQNVQAKNAAQQQNIQLQMAEMDANARNRAAKRNAARQAILNAASNIGQIGKENYFGNITTRSTGYNPLDNLNYTK